MAEEIWKDIIGFPGYQVSDRGRVRNMKFAKPRLLKPSRASGGYNQVVLYNDGPHCILVHWLVAEAFLGRREDHPGEMPGHKNEVRLDDRAENLEWVPAKKKSEARRVYAYLNGQCFYDFDSVTQAAIQMGCSVGSIRNVCNGIGKTYAGYHWSYLSPEKMEEGEIERDEFYMSRAVYQYEGPVNEETWCATYANYLEASHESGVDPDSILNCCLGTTRRAGGFAWDFADKYLGEETEEIE